MDLSSQFPEKPAEQSKKFIAGMRYNWTWVAVIGGTLALSALALALEATQIAAALIPLLIAEVLMMGFQQVVHQGGQAAVDAFVRMAVVIVTGKNGKTLAGPVAPTPESEPTPGAAAPKE